MKVSQVVAGLVLTEWVHSATINSEKGINDLEVNGQEDLLDVIHILQRDAEDLLPEDKRGGGHAGGGHAGGGGHGGGKGGSRGGSNGNRGGQSYGKDLPSYSERGDPPPPYSRGNYQSSQPARDGNPPGPYYATRSYGQRGTTPNYWNGQYYPYRRFGYGAGFLPFMPFAMYPFFLAGPFGFYGPYGVHGGHHNRENSTITNMYVNGTKSNTTSNDGNTTLTNGTYFYVEWDNSEYTLHNVTGGTYEGGVDLGNDTYINGTFHNGTDSSQIKTHVSKINPNFTSNGTELPEDKDDEDEGDSSNTGTSVVAPGVLFVGALLLL